MIEYCALYEKSKCLFELNRTQEAIPLLERAITLAHLHQTKRRNESLLEMKNRLAKFYLREGSQNKAQLILEENEKIINAYQGSLPAEAAITFQLLAEVLFNRDSLCKALTAVNKCIEIYQRLIQKMLKLRKLMSFEEKFILPVMKYNLQRMILIKQKKSTKKRILHILK